MTNAQDHASGWLRLANSRYHISAPVRYGLALSLVALATLARYSLHHVLLENSPFSVYYIAVLLTALVAGRGPGLLAAALGTLAGTYFFFAPLRSFGIDNLNDQITVLLFVVIATIIVLVVNAIQRNRKRLEQMTNDLLASERRYRQLSEELEKRVEERTAELRATIRELESFSYSISHDLRAPLRAVNSFASIVLEENPNTLTEESVRQLKSVIQNGKMMGQLVDELLAFSHLSRTEVHVIWVDTTRLARSVAYELRMSQPPERQIEITIHDLPKVRANEPLLREVLANILTNALKFTRTRPRAIIEIGSVRQDGEEAIFIRDNGVGFDKQYADKLFGVFQRLHRVDEYEGTGIGLALVKRFIERHGGRVWADGKLNEGATFYFTVGTNRRGELVGHNAGTLADARE
jgi:K+-sensing histidine kinase KdpD